jgi:hypothetical protein
VEYLITIAGGLQIDIRVLFLTKDKPNEMTEETGIESSFHDEEELRNYIQKVIEEARTKGGKKLKCPLVAGDEVKQ